MIVTINTDASFHSGFKVGAFAFWIVCDEGRVLHSGAFKEPITNPTQAEIKCIINAVYAVKKQNWVGIKKIIINTDATNAIAILKKDTVEINKYNLKWGGSLRGMYNKIKVGLPEIEFRHVKAHKNTETAKSWVNDWCDKKAKEMLWKQINKTTL